MEDDKAAIMARNAPDLITRIANIPVRKGDHELNNIILEAINIVAAAPKAPADLTEKDE